MPLMDLTNANFDLETERHTLVLIDFWAEWCAPCKGFAPIYAAAAEKHPDVLFARVNTDVESTLAEQFAIRSIPTLLAVKEGSIVSTHMGSLAPPLLEKWIAQLRQS